MNKAQNTKPRSKTAQKKASAEEFTFIDLFAGIGGFNLAASQLGGKCVFASENDENARSVYQKNFLKQNQNLFSKYCFAGDITNVDVSSIPRFDFLFAGFPCQPFSKGGYRRGFKDPRGNLFFNIAKIIDHHKPRFALLENVQNLLSHDSGRTYRTITKILERLGYSLHEHPLILSPDEFGIPVIRKRLFIPAIRQDLVHNKTFTLELPFNRKARHCIYSVIDESQSGDKHDIPNHYKEALKTWNDFYKGIDIKVIGFPVWSKYFKSRAKISHLPSWKQEFIRKNRLLYKRNKEFINKWLVENNNLTKMSPSHRKFEWQAGTDIKDIYDGLIQFRPSGVRVKRPDRFSTLVAMAQHQIIGKYMRKLTPDETKKLQSFPDDFVLDSNKNRALMQLGNSVNVDVVKEVIKCMWVISNKG